MNSFQEMLSKMRELGKSGRQAFGLTLVVAMTVLAAVAVEPVHAQNVKMDLQEALEYQHEGRCKDAIEVYTEVLEKNPGVVQALDWRAMCYIELNELDKALADLDRAIKLSPKYADAYNNRGEVYRKKRDYGKAMADYRTAVQLKKDFAEPYYNMALILESQKKYKAAIDDYRKYLQLQPKAEDRNKIESKVSSLEKQLKVAKAAPPPTKKSPAARHAPPPPRVQHARPAPHAGAVPPKLPGMAKPPEIPGLGGANIPPHLMALVTGLGALASILPFVIYVFSAVMLFLIARKTGTDLPWLAFIPIANLYLMIRIAGKPIWWLAALLVLPVVGVVVMGLAAIDPTGGYIAIGLSVLCFLIVAVMFLLMNLGISSARGKSPVWGVLLFIPCTNLIALAYLGLSR